PRLPRSSGPPASDECHVAERGEPGGERVCSPMLEPLRCFFGKAELSPIVVGPSFEELRVELSRAIVAARERVARCFPEKRFGCLSFLVARVHQAPCLAARESRLID